MVVDSATSSEVHAKSGVPQGSVLGPLLFLIYINGITDLQLSSESCITLYADDILLFKPINKVEDYIDLQNDINSLHEWSQESFLIYAHH